jgi:tetratricopeptide (TPR) repeat protein
MKSAVIAESDRLVQSGIAAQNERKFDDAGVYFFNALTCLAQLPAAEPRRDQTRQLASLFLKGGHEDISLLAAREAIRLEEELNDYKALASDLLFYGNIHQQLGNKAEAKATFEEVIARCLDVHDFANAASASTNLAIMIVEGGDGQQAIKLLTDSLEYLSKERFPETEFNTHATLIQVVDLYGGDPTLAVNSGIAISKEFSDRLTDQHRKALVEPLRKAVEAYLQKQPLPNPDTWKNENLPWVYSDAPGAI